MELNDRDTFFKGIIRTMGFRRYVEVPANEINVFQPGDKVIVIKED